MMQRSVLHLDALQSEFAAKRQEIRARLAEFSAVPPEEYFYELVYCLLTPQSSAVNAAKVLLRLREADARKEDLSLPKLLGDKVHYIRFHNTKAGRIRKARAMIPEVTAAVRQIPDSVELRSWLVAHVDGLGLKEASHFLRNIGRVNLAILDRHILRNLKRYGVIRSLPKTLTPKRYFAIERKFAQFAERSGISMDELDLLFWSRETGQILK